MKKIVGVSMIVLLALVFLAACQTPAGRSAGEVVDDGTITTEVKAKLLNNNITRGIAVTVQTFEGTVTLIGAVNTEKERDRAGQIAMSVKGVKRVKNEITLKKQ